MNDLSIRNVALGMLGILVAAPLLVVALQGSELAGSLLAAGVAVFGFWVGHRLTDKSLQRYESSRSLHRATDMTPRTRLTARRKAEKLFAEKNPRMSRVARKVENTVSLRGISGIRERLLMAGHGDDASVVLYVIAKTGLPLLGGAAMIPVSAMVIDSPALRLLMVAGLAMILFIYPDSVINRRIKTRRKVIENEMPDILDLFVIYTEAGKSFDGALERVIQSTRHRYPTVVRELTILQREFQTSATRTSVYDSLQRRVPLPIIQRLCSVLKQSERVGSPIADTLRRLASDSRRDRIMRAEQKAAKIPIIIQLPIVLFIMPAIFMIILGPASFRIMDALSGLADQI